MISDIEGDVELHEILHQLIAVIFLFIIFLRISNNI